MIKESCNLIGQIFWPITCEPEFSQIWGLHKKTENCNIFHFRLLPAKSNAKT